MLNRIYHFVTASSQILKTAKNLENKIDLRFAGVAERFRNPDKVGTWVLRRRRIPFPKGLLRSGKIPQPAQGEID